MPPKKTVKVQLEERCENSFHVNVTCGKMLHRDKKVENMNHRSSDTERM